MKAVTEISGKIKEQLYLKKLVKQIERHRRKISIFIDTKNFIVKTAENKKELESAFKLRHDVFLKEKLNKTNYFKMDIDKFDFNCDQIIILNKKDNSCIGTYRVTSSTYNSELYSNSEFKLKDIDKLNGNFLELGRACVKKEFRNGLTIMLLWKGIMEYMKKVNTNYLIGCTSINTMDPMSLSLIYNHLDEKNIIDKNIFFKTRRKFRFKNFESWIVFASEFNSVEKIDVEQLLPPLFRFYLKAGAKVCSFPALDKSFKCSDFLTLLNVENLSKNVQKKLN